MRVLLINGSPHKEGCTNRALQEVSDTLNQEGIETEIFWIGNKPIGGCIVCEPCSLVYSPIHIVTAFGRVIPHFSVAKLVCSRVRLESLGQIGRAHV